MSSVPRAALMTPSAVAQHSNAEICRWVDEVASQCVIDLSLMAPHIDDVIASIREVLRLKAELLLDADHSTKARTGPLIVCVFQAVTQLPRSYPRQFLPHAVEILLSVVGIAEAAPQYSKGSSTTARVLLRQIGRSIFTVEYYSDRLHQWLMRTLDETLTIANVELIRGGTVRPGDLLVVAITCIEYMLRDRAPLVLAISPFREADGATHGEEEPQRQPDRQSAFVQQIVELVTLLESRVLAPSPSITMRQTTANECQFLKPILDFLLRFTHALHAQFAGGEQPAKKSLSGRRQMTSGSRDTFKSCRSDDSEATPIPGASPPSSLRHSAFKSPLECSPVPVAQLPGNSPLPSADSPPPVVVRALKFGRSESPRVSAKPQPQSRGTPPTTTTTTTRTTTAAAAAAATVECVSKVASQPEAPRRSPETKSTDDVFAALANGPEMLHIDDVHLFLTVFKEPREMEMNRLRREVANSEAEARAMSQEALRGERMIALLRDEANRIHHDELSDDDEGDVPGENKSRTPVLLARVAAKVRELEQQLREEQKRYREQVEELRSRIDLQKHAVPRRKKV